jgi:hypothetical protein
MPKTGFARLVRVCDERAKNSSTEQMARALLGLVVHGVHKTQALSALDPRKAVHPIKGQPVVALGSHGHDNLMMFGVYAGSQWEPNPDPNDTMYPAVVSVDWDRSIYEVDAGEVRAILGGGPFPRSMKLITRAEYQALRAHATTPVAVAVG